MHRRPRLTRPLAGLALTAGTALLVSGCSSSVEVAAPDDADSPACADVVWPQTVSGHELVATSPKAPWAAAWGDPAIIARCGIPALEPTTLDCVAVDDVDWIVRELSDGTAMSSYGTDPALEVLVPDTYGPGPLMLPVFSDLVRALPSNGRHCD